jgi:hypothetical protein
MTTLFESEFTPLIEQAVRADGTLPVLIISPGWGSSGYYSTQVLKDAATRYRAGTHMFMDHPTAADEKARPERSLQDLAGVLASDAQWQLNGARGPGLYATAKIFSPYRNLIAEIGPHIGLSHRAKGLKKQGTAEGRSGAIIEGIVSVLSVDFVTTPGRGGAVLPLAEAARGKKDLEKAALIRMYESFQKSGMSPAAAAIAAIGRDGYGRYQPSDLVKFENPDLIVGMSESELNLFVKFRSSGMLPLEARLAAVGRGGTAPTEEALQNMYPITGILSELTESEQVLYHKFRGKGPFGMSEAGALLAAVGRGVYPDSRAMMAGLPVAELLTMTESQRVLYNAFRRSGMTGEQARTAAYGGRRL